jgi:DNA-binding response OmpR family regulator
MRNRILLVEDDGFLRENLARLLEQYQYEVVGVGSAAEALRALADKEYHLIVLDLGLPDADGFDLCRHIRQKWRAPILMLTARTDSMDKVIGLEIGADDYLTKPFEPKELLARVRALLRRAYEYQNETLGNRPLLRRNRGRLRAPPSHRARRACLAHQTRVRPTGVPH